MIYSDVCSKNMIAIAAARAACMAPGRATESPYVRQNETHKSRYFFSIQFFPIPISTSSAIAEVSATPSLLILSNNCVSGDGYLLSPRNGPMPSTPFCN